MKRICLIYNEKTIHAHIFNITVWFCSLKFHNRVSVRRRKGEHYSSAAGQFNCEVLRNDEKELVRSYGKQSNCYFEAWKQKVEQSRRIRQLRKHVKYMHEMQFDGHCHVCAIAAYTTNLLKCSLKEQTQFGAGDFKVNWWWVHDMEV